MSDKKEISVETTDWKLGCFLDWRAKSHSETCPTCKGNRTVGGGFKDLDGPQECPTCFGIGSVTKGPTTLKPELPKALVEHMRRAWWDFFNSEQPALAALTSAPAVPEAPDFEQKRARTLLAHLWRRYDAAGTSMGRSHEAVVLEAVLSLLGDPDRVDMALLDKDSGHFINATRDYLSGKMRERLFGKGVQLGERGEG